MCGGIGPVGPVGPVGIGLGLSRGVPPGAEMAFVPNSVVGVDPPGFDKVACVKSLKTAAVTDLDTTLVSDTSSLLDGLGCVAWSLGRSRLAVFPRLGLKERE